MNTNHTQAMDDTQIEHDMATICKRIFSKIDPEEVKRRQRDAAERDRREMQGKIEDLRARWNAPDRHAKKTPPLADDEWHRRFEELKGRLGSGFLVALVGGRGTGKTQMAVEIMRTATEMLRSARFCCALDFFIDVKGTYDTGGKKEGDVLMEYSKPKLLVIDETQERGETPWEDRLLTHLINRRYNEMKDTLLIANQRREEFLASVGPSIASRLVETGGTITCDWASFRK
jgi:DNA replication protein DnaC